MPTDCMGLRQWDLTDAELIFIQVTLSLLKPLAIVGLLVYVYKTFRTAPPHNRKSVLGLEQTRSKE